MTAVPQPSRWQARVVPLSRSVLRARQRSEAPDSRVLCCQRRRGGAVAAQLPLQRHLHEHCQADPLTDHSETPTTPPLRLRRPSKHTTLYSAATHNSVGLVTTRAPARRPPQPRPRWTPQKPQLKEFLAPKQQSPARTCTRRRHKHTRCSLQQGLLTPHQHRTARLALAHHHSARALLPKCDLVRVLGPTVLMRSNASLAAVLMRRPTLNALTV